MIGASLIGPQWWHLGSQLYPLCFLPLSLTDGHLADQLLSFYCIHSQLLLCSEASGSDLLACQRACPQTPISFSSLSGDIAQSPCSQAPCFPVLLYRLGCQIRVFQHSCTSPNASSQGTISSTMKRTFYKADHRIKSGLRLFVIIPHRKVSFWSRQTYIFQSQDASSRLDFFCQCHQCSCPASKP